MKEMERLEPQQPSLLDYELPLLNSMRYSVTAVLVTQVFPAYEGLGKLVSRHSFHGVTIYSHIHGVLYEVLD